MLPAVVPDGREELALRSGPGGDGALLLLLELRDAEGAQNERGEHKDEDRNEHPGGDADGDTKAREGQRQREQYVRPGVRAVLRTTDVPPSVTSLQVAQGNSSPSLPVQGKFYPAPVAAHV